jgi:EAL and modified HD-GYP domain-containing signal transduction protein
MGFEYFQGYFLCKPNLVSTPRLPLNRVSMCRVLAKLQAPDITPREVESAVGEDIALSYRLLRYINSAAVALPPKIESISHAVRLVGIDTIRMFTNLVMLSSLDEKPQELMRTSLVRARMCQLLASSNGCANEDSCFTVGLFSKLDAFLNCGMEAALRLLALTDDVYSALLYRKGALGRMLDMVIAFEQGDWEGLASMNADTAALSIAHAQAVGWEVNLLNPADDDAPPLLM